jgi:hypothetical protein
LEYVRNHREELKPSQREEPKSSALRVIHSWATDASIAAGMIKASVKPLRKSSPENAHSP